jgi:AcrR family transcriptional regulator
MKRDPDKPRKRDVTRRHILDTALALFRTRGFEETTMRDIAEAAGLAVGAAYYHFPAKDALLFAYYADNQDANEERARAHPPGTTLDERLARLFHDRVALVSRDRKLLAALVPRLVNPADPISAFSPESADVRARAIAQFEATLASESMPEPTRRLLGQALWLGHLAVLLYAINDRSRGQRRSHQLVDDLLALAIPLIRIAGQPLATPLIGGLAAALARAGLAP